MKNKLLTLFAILLFCSCGLVEVCVTCTEQDTGISDDFCGSPEEVREHEDELESQGQAYGQNWNCVGS
jgi:hypothetical protein